MSAARLQRLASQLHKSRRWLLLWCTALYVAPALLHASARLLWNDELFTYYIGRLPAMGDVWRALGTGAEQLPPFFYAITRASLAAFGEGPVAMRLPEIAGFWLLGVCVFFFVSRRSSPVYGAVGMLLPPLTGAYMYAYEARPYGLVVGFAALALVCWQAAAEGRRRRLALAGLALSLAAAVASHYYAVLVVAPLAFGELVRTVSRKRADAAIWAAFAGAAAPLLAFLPLIEAASGYAGTFWAKPHWGAVTGFYIFLLGPAALALVAMLTAAALWLLAYRDEPQAGPRIPLHELAAALGYMALPALAVVVAKAVTGAYTDRYVLAAVAGAAILLAWGLFASFGGRATAGVAIVLLLSGLFLTREIRNYRWAGAELQQRLDTIEFLRPRLAQAPVVIADPHLFFELSHYAPPALSGRMLYLADPAAALRHVGTDTVDRGLLALQAWAPLEVRDPEGFLAAGDSFVVYGHPAHWAWLLPELLERKREVSVIGRRADRLLLAVSAR